MAEAIRTVIFGVQGVFQALDSLTSTSGSSSNDRRCTNYLALNWEHLIHVTFIYREEILGQINLIQNKLQIWNWFGVTVTHMDTNKFFFNRHRDRLVSELVNQNKTKFDEMEIPVEMRIRRNINLPGGNEVDVCQTLVHGVKRNLYESHDRLVNELQAQFDPIIELQIIFAVLSSVAILKGTESESEW